MFFHVQWETVWVFWYALKRVLEDKFVADWPQCVSSAPFSQSFSLSQVQLIGMQRPLGQAKKLTGHLSFLLSAGKNKQTKKKNNVESVTISEKPKAF